MILLKPSPLYSSLACVQSVQCSAATFNGALRPQLPPTRPTHRTYARVRDERHPFADDPYTWPEPIPPRQNPTPYQILRQNKGSAYSKVCFNHLVKLYHPDRVKHHGPHDTSAEHLQNLPPHVLLERYRLIVTAHNILSDPLKRSAYDRFGAGWISGSSAGAGSSAASSSWYYNRDRPGKKKWMPGEDPMCNATWEDWEKWHDRQNPDREEQKPQYMSNGTLVAFIAGMTAVGAMAQRGRAEAAQEKTVEIRERAHREASKELRQVQAAGGALEGQDESIKRFLMFRDKNTWEDEAYRRLLPNEDICGGATITKDSYYSEGE